MSTARKPPPLTTGARLGSAPASLGPVARGCFWVFIISSQGERAGRASSRSRQHTRPHGTARPAVRWSPQREGRACPCLRCSWLRRGPGARGGSRGAEVVGAKALERPHVRAGRGSGAGGNARAPVAGEAGRPRCTRCPSGPCPCPHSRPHTGTDGALATAYVTPHAPPRPRRASGRPCAMWAHASPSCSCATGPHRRGPWRGHGHPPCGNGAICFPMLITPLFLGRSTIFNILLLLLKDNIRGLKA